MAQMAVQRRERDRLLDWAIKGFMVLSICSTLASLTSSAATYSARREMAAIRTEIALIKDAQIADAQDRAARIKGFQAQMSQFQASIQIRDGEIALIKKKLKMPSEVVAVVPLLPMLPILPPEKKP